MEYKSKKQSLESLVDKNYLVLMAFIGSVWLSSDGVDIKGYSIELKVI